MASVVLRVKLAIVEIEADGSACAICGDAMYLRAWDLIVIPETGGRLRTGSMFCGSCGDAVREQLAVGE